MSYIIVIAVIALIIYILANVNGYNNYIKQAYEYQGKSSTVFSDDNDYYYYNQVCKLDWETIKSIYQVCPERWKLVKNTVCNKWVVLYNSMNESFPGRLDYKWKKGSTICVIVPFKHWKKMKSYEKKYNNRKKESEISVSTQILIQCAQNDINRLKKVAQSQIDEANNMMKDIAKKGCNVW